MGNSNSRRKKTPTPDSGVIEEVEHFCSIQIGNQPPVSLEFSEVTNQFGNTYVYFKIPKDKYESSRYQEIDLKYQRGDSITRSCDHLSREELLERLDGQNDSAVARVPNLNSHKNIINGQEYQEYRIESDKKNIFILRYPMDGKQLGIISYQFTR